MRKQLFGTLALSLMLLLAACTDSDTATPKSFLAPSWVSAVTAECAAWDASTAYNGGSTVTYEGQSYEAKWWSQGDNPTQSGQWGVWKEVAACGDAPSPNPAPPAPTPQPGGGSDCNAQTWTRGVNYQLGAVVKFPGNGLYYKVVNVGTNGSDGTDPTISTWYWEPTECTGPTPAPNPAPNPTPDPAPNPNPAPNPGGFLVTEAQYNQMFPQRIPYYNYSGFIGALEAWPAFANAGSDTVKRQEAAAFLANMHHESGGGRYVREINQANWPLYCSLGVGNCGGKQYYGRGPTQLSWDYNYRSAGQALGIDLLNNPDLVADDSTIGWKTALWYWMTQKGLAPQTPHEAMVSGTGFGGTIRAINGGLECDGNGAPQRNTRIQLYTQFTGILGVPTGNNLSC